MIKVIVADDHQLVREGVKKVLESEPEIVVVGEAQNLAETLALLDVLEADILLLDLSLSPIHELDALRCVNERFPAVRTVVLTSHSEAQFGIAALRLGAIGYVSKSLTADVLAKAIYKAHSGARYLSEGLAELLADEIMAPQARLPHERLTERERQVLHLIADGSPVKQAAARLDISISSVNTYRSRIFTKLKVRSNNELTRYAIRHGLIT